MHWIICERKGDSKISRPSSSGLTKDLLSLRNHPALSATVKKLTAMLRLSSSALFGSNAFQRNFSVA